MQKNDLSYPLDGVHDERSNLVGTMKGTIIHSSENTKFEFVADVVRREANGEKLRLYAAMRLSVNDSPMQIELQLANKDAPTGEYTVGTPEVVALFIHYPFNPFFKFEALAGEKITFQNHAPDLIRINGRLNFKTEKKGNDQFDVDVVFDVAGIQTT